MNGKERVQNTLHRQPVDRVPIGIVGIDYDTVEKILGHETYLRAKVKSQIALWEGRRDEVVQSWIEDSIAVHRKLDLLDIVRINGPYSSLVPPRGYQPERVRRVNENTWESERGWVWKTSELTDEVLLVSRPTEAAPAQEAKPQYHDLETVAPPDPSIFEVVDAVIAAFRDSHYILGPSGDEAGLILLDGQYSETSFMAYAEQPDTIRRAIALATRQGNAMDQWYIRPGTDGVFWCTDFASNAGPMISPRTFRSLCLPSIQERVQQVKAKGCAVFKHACGNNARLLDMFVEAGYDAYQSIQPSAGMTVSGLKPRYGQQLVLWGDVSVESLVGGTVEDVRREARCALETGAPGGGFIFGPSHTIAYGTQYDNFLAMLDEFNNLAWKAANITMGEKP